MGYGWWRGYGGGWMVYDNAADSWEASGTKGVDWWMDVLGGSGPDSPAREAGT